MCELESSNLYSSSIKLVLKRFIPGTFILYRNEKYIIICSYREIDGEIPHVEPIIRIINFTNVQIVGENRSETKRKNAFEKQRCGNFELEPRFNDRPTSWLQDDSVSTETIVLGFGGTEFGAGIGWSENSTNL